MTEIYLIRHAQAEGNAYRMMQGQWDGGVTKTGLLQIDALAERFKDTRFDAVYSSDLYRTRLTASAITRYHRVPFYTTEKLREINMGSWETRFFGDVLHESPQMARNFVTDPDSWQVEGAETFTQVTDRVYPELVRIAQAHPGQTVAAVSHGVALRCALSKITGYPLTDLERLPICRNTAVTKLIWDGNAFSVEFFDDCSHLDALGLPAWLRADPVRGVSFDPAEERDFYLACYKDAWLAAHGSTEGFSSIYLDSAAEHHRDDPEAVQKMLRGDEVIGLVDLDTRRGAGAGYGWISLIYLKPEYRARGYGIQLLARPMFKYKAMGRKALRLHVAESNKPALDFYRRCGFEVLSWENGSLGRLLLMEKKLGGPQDEN